MRQHPKHLLIVEGNHEALVGRDSQGNIEGAAEKYAACLQHILPDLQMSITRPHFGDDPAPPPDFNRIDGVVFTGAGVAWSASAPQAKPATVLMDKAFKLGKPVFGSCYGMQIGCVVLGGRVGANPNGPELAIARDITLLEAGENHPLYAQKPSQFDALCMHRDDVFETGSDLRVLSHNSHCAIQSVASPQKASASNAPLFCGVQYHPELRFSDISSYIKRSDIAGFSQRDYLEKNLKSSITSVDEVVADFDALAERGDNSQLRQKYQLSETVMSRKIHETELANWLNLI